MPAKSQRQAVTARIALAAKKGKVPVSRLKGAARSMYKSMSASQLEDFATTKRKKLPRKKAK